MNTSNEDTVLKAMEDARRILVEYLAAPRDATQTVYRLLAVLDQVDVGRALDRIKRRRTMRLVGETRSLDAVADRGYFSSPEILACHEAGITVTLPSRP